MNKLGFVAIIVMGLALGACNNKNHDSEMNVAASNVSNSGDCYNGKCNESITKFFGDSAYVFTAKDLQNGYRVSILHNEQLNLIHLEKGDSINRYCEIHDLPFELKRYEIERAGIYTVDWKIPVIDKDTLANDDKYHGVFFMDVNFDGNEELVVAYEGYNRTYYTCFDLATDLGSGLIKPITEPPYNNIVSGTTKAPSFSFFNRKKKEIYIYENMGNSEYEETWAKMNTEELSGERKMTIYKKECHCFALGKEIIETYKMINDTLKLVDRREILIQKKP